VDTPFRLGEWLVEPRLNRLTRGDESIQIEHKMMDVLVCLAEMPGDLVPRQRIIDTVWAIEFISEGTLTRIVAELRRALRDDAREPRFIETIRGKGYRLLVSVEVERPASATTAQFPARAPEDDRNPYPGLAAFTEADAEFFFGRETEVSALWRKITSRRLLAVIGPSGVGKTSFLRAGLLPAMPEGWGILICQPGEAPFAALARALAPEFEGDAEAISRLVDINNQTAAVAGVSRWRDRHDQALLIVDQFEELFTLNPPEVQAEFATLIGRLARDVDVHVVLSMRDDFLYRCHEHEALAPVFSVLMPIKVPGHDDLRRALVEPAARFGCAFEDEGLVDEMLDAVAGERGALPLAAFAVERLWVHRDREKKLLTRRAYADIGGVAGALAHHAETTLERIGAARLPVIRELFRNLVTSEGTRAVHEWDELLSVFEEPQKPTAEGVLRALIDARLLTSYEIREEGEEPTRRVEIIHESLLANWPRLVRWQTQDADSAQLRDQLRQAARTWNERGRSDDLLWTGSAYREFSVWLVRYPGGLTETEEAFAEAMTRHAERRGRRRRLAAAAAFVVLLAVLAIVGGLWRRSVSEAQRAEAANLFSLGQLWLEEHPTAAVAYAIASLELADNPEVRRLALDALWRGPTEIRIPSGSPYSLDFSPDGRWLATAVPEGGVTLWPSDGGPPTELEITGTIGEGRISPNGDVIAYTLAGMKSIGLWTFPDGRWLRSIEVGGTWSQNFWFSQDGKRLITSTENLLGDFAEVLIRSWPLAGGEPDLLARLEAGKQSLSTFFGVDPTESLLGWVDGSGFNLAPREIASSGSGQPTLLEHDRFLLMAVFDEAGRQLATTDAVGTLRVWSLDHEPPEVTHTAAGVGNQGPWSVRFDPSGAMLGASKGLLGRLTTPPDAEWQRLHRATGAFQDEPQDPGLGVAFHPDSTWFATGHLHSVSLWPLTRPYARVFRGHEFTITHLQFTPDGDWLASTSEDGTVRLWPVGSGAGRRSRILYRGEGSLEAPIRLAMAPDGSFLVAGTYQTAWVLPLDGGPPRELTGFNDLVYALAVDQRSRLVAGGAGFNHPEQAIVRVWDLGSGETRILDAGDGKTIDFVRFTADGHLWVASGEHTIRRWDLVGDRPRVLEEIDLTSQEHARNVICDLDLESRQVLVWREPDRLWIQDLDSDESRELSSQGPIGSCGFDSTGTTAVWSDVLGAVRVGQVAGDEPHLLLGHEGHVESMIVSPNGRWIASGGDDSAVRLWPMPDLSKPPLHTLPRDELIAKLKTLTNLRVVRDEESSTGWKIEVGPFPGWETVPTW
jgi:WD40 repeat protein/DNA-binding winged helix-turn-helix (wHTH) protein